MRLNMILALLPVSTDSLSQDFREEPASGLTPAYYVRDFGATGDGSAYDTRAIQNAIDECSKRGGGIVYFSKGTYLVGTLILKSHVTMHLESEATILGSPDLEKYRPLKLDMGWEKTISEQAKGKKHDFGSLHLIYAQEAKNIAIVGQGVIDGQGASFWDENWRPLDRPHQMIQFEACENVLVRGVILRNSPFWALHFLGCDQVKVEGVRVVNPRKGPNTDGIDVNSSSNVFISNCYIETGDDSICLKARLENKACENITVSNCVMISDDSAIKLGTRSNGDIRHVVFTNCVIRNTRYGIGLYMKDGGSYEDIHFSNITIESEDIENLTRATYPILVDLEKRTESSKLGTIRNIVFDNISINTAGHCLFGGLPNKPIEDLTLHNIRVRVTSGQGIIVSRKPRGVREIRKAAPETDYASVPANFTFVNVRGLTIRDLQIKTTDSISERERHALWGICLQEVIIDGFKGRQEGANGKLATLNLKDCGNVFIRDCQALKGTGIFLRLEGKDTDKVSLIGNDLSEANKAFDVAKDVRRNVFYQSSNRLP